MLVGELAFPFLPLHILVNQIHRTRPIQSNQRNQIPNPLQIKDRTRSPHPGRLNLKHPHVFCPI